MAIPSKQPYYKEVFDNIVLSRLKESPERITGMIAYGIFETLKDEYFATIPNPDKASQDHFLQVYGTAEKQKEYLLSAEKLLEQYASIYASETYQELITEVREVRTEVKKAQIDWRMTIWLGVVSSINFVWCWIHRRFNCRTKPKYWTFKDI